MANTSDLMDKLVSLSKRRGFVFQSSEIYGGTGSVWDYGPLGVELKNNVKQMWWRSMVHERDDIEGIDAAILMHPKVWEASGHVAGFSDPLVECSNCHRRFRTDAPEIQGKNQCPVCGKKDTFGEPRNFNLMFKTFMGAVEDSAATVYLRPETAQGIYVNFQNVLTSTRQRIPFGIAQIGKAFRNEITPGNFVFRTREFEQMEMQFFVEPGSDDEWMSYWKEKRMQWVLDLGINKEKLRFHQHGPNDLAHYAKDAYDIEYEMPFGWQEFEGVHNRTDFDLNRHQEYSGKKLEYVDPVDRAKRYVPYIIETSAGADRTTLVVMMDAYREEQLEGEVRTVMGFHPRIAPIKAAILPLVNKDGMPEFATKLHAEFKRAGIPASYDDGGSIGKRYRRQDEAGTPFAFTIDGQSSADQTVTVRDRDTLKQERIAASQVVDYVRERIAST